MNATLHDLMMTQGVSNHPEWFAKIGLLHWPMEHQLKMVHTYAREMRWLDAGEPGIGKTYPAQIHGILMAALGNKVVYTMPPKLMIQFYREFGTFFKGIHNHLRIVTMDMSSVQKKKQIAEWETNNSWPDILIMSYGTNRLLNDIHKGKNIGRNLWRLRNLDEIGTKEEFRTMYFDADGNAKSPKSQPYTPDGRKVDRDGKAVNPWQMLLKRRGYHVNFYDEAHALCGMDSIISMSIADMAEDLGDEVALYLMTGTPIPTHLHDVYGIIRLVNPKAYLGKSSFMRQHCILQEFNVPLPNGKKKTIRSVVDYMDTEKIYDNLWARASRVQKRDVVSMPDPVISEVPVRLEGPHKRLYNDLINNRFAELGDLVLAPDNQSALRHMALQIISSPEHYGYTGANSVALALEELMDSIKPSAQKKTIIFAYYKSTMAELAKKYEAYNPCVVFGETSDAQRQIDRFCEDPDSPLLIINWIAGGAGLNLQVASYIIFYECPTSPKDAKQAIARADRKGQTKIVNVYFLRVLKTLSDKNFRSLLKNEESNNRAIKDKHDLLHELMRA